MKPVIVNGKRWTWDADGYLHGPDGERAVLSHGALLCSRENGWTSVELPVPVEVAKALIEREEGAAS